MYVAGANTVSNLQVRSLERTKFEPETVTDDPPVVGPSVGASVLTLSAARNMNFTPSFVKSTPLFATSTSTVPITSDSGATQTTKFELTHSVFDV
eukprot:282713-Rhodomonas_salina.1